MPSMMPERMRRRRRRSPRSPGRGSDAARRRSPPAAPRTRHRSGAGTAARRAPRPGRRTAPAARIDAGIAADAARQVGADQAELVDGVVQHLDGDPGVQERHRGAGPEPARISRWAPPSPRSTFVATSRPSAGGEVGEGDRQRPDRADHVHLMAEPVHVLELLVEIELLGPAVDRHAAAGARR